MPREAWQEKCTARAQGSAGAGMVALVQQGLGWIPTACNLAAALAFAIALSLNDQLTGTSDAAIFAIAPLLLLLTQAPPPPPPPPGPLQVPLRVSSWDVH